MNETREEKVLQFHKAFGLSVNQEPSVQLLELRKTLISEEVKELIYEIDLAIKLLQEKAEIPKELWTNILKEMADVQIVLSGTAVSLRSINNLEDAFNRVHESNMTKLGSDGLPVYREDGKVLKGPNYKPPYLDDLV